jgi:hypothetical protein
MLQFLWLAQLRERWLGKVMGRSRKRNRPAARPGRYRRLHLETLEDRLVPSGGVPAPVVNPSVPGLISPSPSPSSAPPSAPAPPGTPPPLSGTWTKVAGLPTTGLGTMLLLPNGGVMIQGPGVSNAWYELQPDASGDYATGNWTQLANMSETRLYFGSVVLPNDKVFVLGGEYPTFDNTGQLYDIATNTWTSIPNFPQGNFGDDPTTLLPNGEILCGYYGGPQTYLYNPATNSWSNGPTKLNGDASDEETWIKLPVSAALPQGGILSWSIFASIGSGNFTGEVYNIATNTWTATKNSTTSPPQLLSSSNIGYELGGGLLLPNGKVFQIGANGNTALYDPSTNTWSAGPQILDNKGNLLGSDDAPASILPDGQVIFTADFGPTKKTFASPTEMFDYDYTTNKITQMTNLPPGNDFSGAPAFIDRTMVLPSGQLLFNDGTNLYLFTPSDSAQSTWLPTITNIVKTSSNSYTLTGLQLTGISEGSSYGDDVNVSENYPIVQLTSSSGQVYYATTSNWNYGAIGTGMVSAVGDTTVQTVDFTLPDGIPNGNYQVAVIANGISSLSQNLTVGLIKVKTVAQNPSAMTFSTNQQTMQLTADVGVVSGSQTVNTGTVTFTVQDSKGNTVGKAVQGTVTDGVATANFTLPGNAAAGTYTVAVSYSDNSDTFLDSSDSSATFAVNPAQATISALNTTTPYSPLAQTLTLTANIADASFSSDTIGEGTVTFTVRSGGTTLGTAQGAVLGGVASGIFVLPSGQVPGNYSIAVSYSDSAGNFSDSGDTSGTLSVTPDNVTTQASSLSAAYSLNTPQTVQLKATVAAANIIAPGAVGEGDVTFTITSGGTVIGRVQGTVTGGIAKANFDLPAGLAAGTYAIGVNYNDSTGNFSDNGDSSGTLTITPALVTTTAAPSNLTFRTAPQTVGLSATVADNIYPNDIINEGTVTFTVKSGSTVIANAVANVINGVANSNFTWSAGRSTGTYTIGVSYADSLGNFSDSQDVSSTFTVAPASVTAAASNSPSVISSSNAQNVTLTASVADTSYSSDTVNEGTVTFTVEDKNGKQVGQAVTGTVTNGTASAVYAVPGGLAVGSYTVAVSYSDSQGNFSDNGSSDSTSTLTVNPANVATTANSVSTVYSSNIQGLALSASVANTSVPSNTVGEGTVTFTITDSNDKTVGSVDGNVQGGTANAVFNLPAGQALGTYTIAVSYSDTTGSGNFIDHGDTSATLTITPANVTTKANSVATVSYSPNGQTLALSATVTDVSVPAGAVNEGVVTFTVANGSTVIDTPVQATVSGGTANASFNLPAGQALGIYTITISYSDGSGNFKDINNTGATFTVTPANVTTTAGGGTAVYSPNGQSLALSAKVTDTSIPTDTVNEGVVNFTVANGSTVLGTVQGNVTGGTANANFSLPGGQAVGNYSVTVSYNDNSSHFLDSGDTSGTLNIAPAQVTTTANPVSAAFSPNTQTLTLGASVTDTSIPTDTVSQGSVTFTVTSGSTTLGTATSFVSGGKANASFSLPAGQALGTYAIAVSYSNTAGNFIDNGSSDAGATLTVKPASVTTTAGNVSSLYSLTSQTLQLSAALTDASVPSDIVTEGIVTFTVRNGSTALGSVQGTVSNGRANAEFTAPAGLNAGNYTIAVSYSDSSGFFTDGGDAGGTLTITPASVTTTASSTSTTFSTGPQTLALNATVTDPGPTLPNVVNEGVVTFTILSGPTVLGSVQGAVNGGTAHADFTLPAGLAAGNYIVVVHYSDNQGNFADSGDTNATLAVSPAATTTQLLEAHFEPNYSSQTVTETITAHVAGSTQVNRGTVTFALSTGQMLTANVDGNGNATAVVTLPMLDVLHPQSINISYTDASHNLISSTDADTASWQWSTPLLPTYAAFSPNSVTLDLFGLFITFTNGVLTEIDYGSTHVVFSYNTSGQLDQVTFDGMNLLP